MTWQLQTRRGWTIATGTLQQMFMYLKSLVPDGEYRLVGSKLNIPARRWRGKIIYPRGLEGYISSLQQEDTSGD